MRSYLKKYGVLLTISYIVTQVLFLSLFTLLSGIDMFEHYLSYFYLIINLPIIFLINIVFTILINRDLKKEEVKSTPLLFLVLISSYIGVIIFLLFMASKKLNHKRTIAS